MKDIPDSSTVWNQLEHKPNAHIIASSEHLFLFKIFNKHVRKFMCRAMNDMVLSALCIVHSKNGNALNSVYRFVYSRNYGQLKAAAESKTGISQADWHRAQCVQCRISFLEAFRSFASILSNNLLYYSQFQSNLTVGSCHPLPKTSHRSEYSLHPEAVWDVLAILIRIQNTNASKMIGACKLKASTFQSTAYS